MDRDRKYLEYVISGIQAQHQAKVDSANQWRDREIEDARAWFRERGGSDRDFDSLSNKVTANGSTDQETPQQSPPKTDGPSGRTVSTDVIIRYVYEVLNDFSVEVVTQTEAKNRLLEDYPDAKVPSVRSGIANYLRALRQRGYLDLIEEGRAGQPNKYRRTEELLELLETKETSLLET